MSGSDRMEQFRQLVQSQGERSAQAAARVAEIAASVVEVETARGDVRVSMTGDGVIQSIVLSGEALDTMTSTDLAQHLMGAVNEALTTAEQRFEDARNAGPGSDVTADLARFEGRMDDLLARLDRLLED